MDIILCTVSSTDYNDAIVPGLVHFSLSSHLKDNFPVYAVYQKETNTLDLHIPDQPISKIVPDKESSAERSARYSCIWQLLSRMKRGDRLMVQALADLGATPDEAFDHYSHALEKEIVISFYDASYIDSQTLAVGPEPTIEESRLIRRIINNYYRQKNNAPVLSRDELTALGGTPAPKKKSDA